MLGNLSRRERICRRCVERLLPRPDEVPVLRDAISIAATFLKASAGQTELDAPAPASPRDPVSGEPTGPVPAGEVLAAFRRAVEEQIGPRDTAARLDLGIAYEEMGLLDEAIWEFEIAAADPALTATARGLIGLCHVIAGRADEAIGAYADALKTPHLTARVKGHLYFELAKVLAQRGEDSKARRAFDAAVAADPETHREFPGVPARLLLRGAREAFASGGSRDAFAPHRGDEPEPAEPDPETCERILRADPDDHETRAVLVALLLDGDMSAEARPHLELLVEHYRRVADTSRLRACERRLAELSPPASDRDEKEFACSFCGSPTDVRRPPARSDVATICAECLLGAKKIFEIA